MKVTSGRGLTIPTIVRQHVDDTAVLFEIRTALSVAPHVKLLHLRRFDHRVAAHLDAVAVAGHEGASLCRAALEEASPGSVFAATVESIESGDGRVINELLALAESRRELTAGLIGALGWVDRSRLRGIVNMLLRSPHPFRRMIGLGACAMHAVDPGLESAHWVADSSAMVRSRVLRTLGELGRDELASVCSAAITDPDPDCRFWASWSAVLLSSRGTAIEMLIASASVDGRHRGPAFVLTLQALDVMGANTILKRLAEDLKDQRWLLQGCGIVGDPTCIPWLMDHMSSDRTARRAGEAFTLITGADLAWLDLERKPPEDFESGPNDDPNDPNVDMDPDDGLPWPDVKKVEAWWQANESRFQKGIRYFLGKPVTREHCVDVLKNGYQRQRILAAQYLCLLEPGTPLFNTSAPAWRQQRLLAAM